QKNVSYDNGLQDALEALLRDGRTRLAPDSAGLHGRLLLLQASQIPRSDAMLFDTVARVVLLGRNGTLTQQLLRAERPVAPAPARARPPPPPPPPAFPRAHAGIRQWLRRLRRSGTRIRHYLGRRRPHSQALGQRRRQRRLRLPGLGIRLRLHLGVEQP